MDRSVRGGSRAWLPVVATAFLAFSCATAGTLGDGLDNGGPDGEAPGADASNDGAPSGNDAGFAGDTGSSSDGGADAPATIPDANTTDAKKVDAAPPVDASGADGSVTDASPVCAVVVNELMTGVTGSATNEWVEIYNPCATSVDLSGAKLVYRAGTNVSASTATFDTTLFAWPNGASIAAHGFLLYAGAGYAGASDGALVTGIKDGDGAVGIRNAGAALVDSVGYGAVLAANAFIETTAAPANAVVATPGNSIRRLPDGHDTNNNAADFANTTTPTPKATNQ